MRKIEFNNKIKICILVALSVVLMYFRLSVPFLPNFLTFDLSDIPIFFITIIFSPILGVISLALKNLLVCFTMGSFTFGIGELANFLMGFCFIVPGAYFYKKFNGKNRYIFSLLSGMIGLTLSGVILNATVILPVYVKLLGVELSSFIGEANTLLKFLIIYIVPYNVIKSMIIFFPTVAIIDRFKK
ncbi:ECF transporter S component [Candidatus Arthromitus sp. SFB-rat-Yit]|uniref:ECF transporter S component n=1 Tax=Candidatus Arthromitus sp. SFB-rat-Yit TaxID=1041504 RepID=UPI000227A5F8|nr:ECF transporter S component [Candidatus Arthromitus sp. SFB-rat-Yit]BAK81653.1 riboflavin transporter [Candidatus Arthromitus sp. SFB-rat-Yit]